MGNGSRQEGQRCSFDPGGVAGAVERGEKVAGLSPGHVAVAFGFTPGRDAKPFRGAEGGGKDAGHVVVTRELIGCEIQPAGEARNGLA